MSVKKYALFLCAAYAATQLLTGCGSEEAQQPAENNKSQNASCCDLSKTKDGTYTAESSVDKVHGKAVITLTIKDHKITAVEYISGATINYDQFVEAVKKDLEQANQ